MKSAVLLPQNENELNEIKKEAEEMGSRWARTNISIILHHYAQAEENNSESRIYQFLSEKFNGDDWNVDLPKQIK